MRHPSPFLVVAAVVLMATAAGAVDLWFAQIGSPGGSATVDGGPTLGFTLGGTAPGAAENAQTSGHFGFWILPGGALVPVAVGDETPLAAALMQNYPNPVHSSTTLPFRVGATDKSAGPVPVRLDVFDVAGRRVATLVDDVRAPGDYRVQWDGRDRAGRAVASGVYFARFSTGDVNQTVRMLRVR
jgi:hypothetical protein